MNNFDKCAFSGFITLGIAMFIDLYFNINILESNIQFIIVLLVLFSGIFIGMTFNASKIDVKEKEGEQ